MEPGLLLHSICVCFWLWFFPYLVWRHDPWDFLHAICLCIWVFPPERAHFCQVFVMWMFWLLNTSVCMCIHFFKKGLVMGIVIEPILQHTLGKVNGEMRGKWGFFFASVWVNLHIFSKHSWWLLHLCPSSQSKPWSKLYCSTEQTLNKQIKAINILSRYNHNIYVCTCVCLCVHAQGYTIALSILDEECNLHKIFTVTFSKGPKQQETPFTSKNTQI